MHDEPDALSTLIGTIIVSCIIYVVGYAIIGLIAIVTYYICQFLTYEFLLFRKNYQIYNLLKNHTPSDKALVKRILNTCTYDQLNKIYSNRSSN